MPRVAEIPLIEPSRAAVTRAPLAPAWCAACGQATGGRPCTNRWCRRSDRGWSVVHSVGFHQGAFRRAIVGYKYGGQMQTGPILAGVLARHLRDHQAWFEEYDLLTDVPSFLGAGARRTWSPVGRIVSDLRSMLRADWDVQPDLVVKVEETEPMSGLSRWARTRVAEGPLRQALHLGRINVAGARILVVDDVFTEGSTLREVARVLRAGGADEVAGLVLARPPRRGLAPAGASATGGVAPGGCFREGPRPVPG
jgi:predicted amidophosphoribosyltransferase